MATLPQRVAKALASLALVIGGIVLLSWILGISLFGTASGGHPNMKFNTSLAILLLGLALLLHFRSGSRRARLIAPLLSILALGIGLLTLGEYLLARDFGIDELFFSDSYASKRLTLPGRMSPITAVVITLMAAALLLLRFFPQSSARIRQSFNLGSLFLLFLASLSYLYNANSLAGIYPYYNMAIHTALALALLNLSILLYFPSTIMDAFNGPGLGGRIGRRILPASLLTLVTLGLITRLGTHFEFLDASVDVVFIVSLSAVILTWLVWRNAENLNKLESALHRNEDSLRKSRDQAQELSEHLQLLLECTPGATAMLDRNMRYLWVSQRWASYFGLKRAELVGRSHYEVYPEDSQRMREVHKRCLAGATEKAKEDYFERPGAEHSWVSWEIKPWYDRHCEIGGLIFLSEDITEKKRAEEARRKSEEQYQLLVESVRDYALFLIDTHGFVTSWNTGAALIKGYSESEIVGKHFSLFYTAEDKAAHKPERELRFALEHGKFAEEGWRVRKDGSRFWANVTITPVLDQTGAPLGFTKVTQDISPLKAARDRLERLNAELEQRVFDRTKEVELHAQVLQTMAEGVALLRAADGAVVYANPKFARMFGYEPGELEGLPFSVIHHGRSPEIAAADFRELVAQARLHSEISYERINRRKDGTPFWCHSTASLFQHSRHGSLLVLIQEDTSDRKRGELELRESEQRFRDVVELAGDGIFEADLSGRYLNVNRAGIELLGYPREELLKLTISDLIPQEDRSRLRREIEETLKTGSARIASWNMTKKDGSSILVEICTKFVPSNRLLGFARDLSERKKREQQQECLAETASILNETMDHGERLQRTANALVPVFADFCVVGILEKGEFRFKATAARDPAKKRIMEKMDPAETLASEGPYSVPAVLRSGKSLLMENVAEELQRNSSIHPIQKNRLLALGLTSYAVIPLIANGKPFGTMHLGMASSSRSFSRDDMPFLEMVVSRCAMAVENARLYREAQEAIVAREGILAVVSHDLKSPLTSISLSAQLLARQELPPERTRAIGERMHQSTGVMQRLISDLLDFGKIEAGVFKIVKTIVDARAIVQSTLDTLLPLAHAKGVHLKVDPFEVSPDLLCDRERVVQVLSNLLSNAIKFTPEGGTVTVRCKAEGDFLRFTVADTGPGIAHANLPRVFERFWQAEKTSALGTGLGLSIAKGLVEAHGGTIWVESEPGTGANFHFTIPLFRAQGAQAPHPSSQKIAKELPPSA